MACSGLDLIRAIDLIDKFLYLGSGGWGNCFFWVCIVLFTTWMDNSLAFLREYWCCFEIPLMISRGFHSWLEESGAEGVAIERAVRFWVGQDGRVAG